MKHKELLKELLILFGVLLIVACSFYVYKEIFFSKTVRSFKLIERKDDDSVWCKVQENSKDTVVQIFADVAYFDWLEPYKSPEQDTVRGSGFFINNEGYILSNFHVVDEVTSIKIQIPSLGRERFDVEVVGVCPEIDIALLKLKDSVLKQVDEKLGKIPYLKLGDSDKILRTQEVLVLGYPLGQEKLKSAQGIVSGRERVWGESYIQITAPINSGNSGGPALNLYGEVVGINTASISRAENVGYIVPINNVKNVLENLYKVKLLRRPMLGCKFNIATEDMVKCLHNPVPGGIYISQIYKNSLIGKAGVKEGDMLYEINGYIVDRFGEISVPWNEDKIYIRDLINRIPIGDWINLVLYRNGEKKEIGFKFNVIDLYSIRTMHPEYEKIDYEILGGLILMELKLNHIFSLKKVNPYLIKYKREEKRFKSRVVVSHVFPGSQAKLARNIFSGDIVEEINGEKIRTLTDFRRVLRKSKKTSFFTLKTEDKNFMVLSINKILQEEDNLARTYFYKKSNLLTMLH